MSSKIYLTVIPSQNMNLKVSPASIVQDFPIRGKGVYLGQFILRGGEGSLNVKLVCGEKSGVFKGMCVVLMPESVES